MSNRLRSTRGPTPFLLEWRLCRNGGTRGGVRSLSSASTPQAERIHRLSQLWNPTGGIAVATNEDGHAKLLRAGFLRQAHSGIFHLLPLGRRVQDKIERLVDRHMKSLGASRLDLSSISSQDLWSRSGRLSKVNSELFLFRDRKDTGYLLSPTHEEEITSLVSSAVKSYKDLPVRLYQITRKYRDELRPRHGLLRSREFIMKDLYTFDLDSSSALATYYAVRNVYKALFDELNVPYLVADADSGDMGGNLSHEFHFPTPVGEDHIISCTGCDYVANEELAETSSRTGSDDGSNADSWLFVEGAETNITRDVQRQSFTVWRGINRDRSTLINVWYALENSKALEVNTHAVKSIVSDLDPGVEDPVRLWLQRTSSKTGAPSLKMNIINMFDHKLPKSVIEAISLEDTSLPINPAEAFVSSSAAFTKGLTIATTQALNNLLRIKDGDLCPKCHNSPLKVEKAIELGHTFFLGTRYSEPLSATITVPSGQQDEQQSAADVFDHSKNPSNSSVKVPMQMGCHGIGISRMIGAIAETLSDAKGLNWPRIIAPYEVAVIPPRGSEVEALSSYSELVTLGAISEVWDTVLDDRELGFAWKMNDADLVGYPVLVVMGRSWQKERSCEIQCRRLGIKETVPVADIREFVEGILAKL